MQWRGLCSTTVPQRAHPSAALDTAIPIILLVTILSKVTSSIQSLGRAGGEEIIAVGEVERIGTIVFSIVNYES